MVGSLQACKREASIYKIPTRKERVTDRVLYIEKATNNGNSSLENTGQHNKPDGVDLHDLIPSEELQSENSYFSQKRFSFKARSFKRKLSDYGTERYGRSFAGNRAVQRGLLERLIDKFSSEPGMGFASAVVGCVARNIVLSGYEVMQRSKKADHERDFTTEGSEWELRALAPDVCEVQQQCEGKQYVSQGRNGFKGKTASDKHLPKENSGSGLTRLESLLDFASDSRGKSLIAKCIKVFVATAVSVYLDKTKDVNVYEDFVAGLTKPSHKVPAKELLRSVCSGAVETLVRTSHEVLSRQTGPDSNQLDLHQHEHAKQDEKIFSEDPRKDALEVVETSVGTKEGDSMRRYKSTTLVHEKDDSSTKSITLPSEVCDSMLISENTLRRTLSARDSSHFRINEDGKEKLLGPQPHQHPRTTVTKQRQGSNGGPINLIDGLSKALAVPSNRKLVIDVAGAIASEAVRSFFDVILSIFKPVFGGEAGRQEHARILSFQEVSYLGLDKVRHITKILIANSLVLSTLWLAVIMHIFTTGFLEPV
ncbi:hypothetical protein O6H91_07G047100 [Diphasiastrum complanatum]|nr:hypothetical protein O6H91_07G047100 [Diphasiastrum complanatum]